MRNSVIYMVLAALLLTIPNAVAQDKDVTKHPGYVDLDFIKIPDAAEEVVEIDLGQGILSIVQMFVPEDEQDELDSELGKLFNIRVKSFTMEDDVDIQHMRKIIEKKDKDFAKQDWVRIIKTRTKNDYTIIYSKKVKGRSVGMLIMSVNVDGEATFVNIVGGVSMEAISDIGLGLSDSTMKALRENFD